MVQCAWCGGIKIGPWYIALRRTRLFVREWTLRLPLLPPIALGTTHGICPECLKSVDQRAADWRRPANVQPLRERQASAGSR